MKPRRYWYRVSSPKGSVYVKEKSPDEAMIAAARLGLRHPLVAVMVEEREVMMFGDGVERIKP